MAMAGMSLIVDSRHARMMLGRATRAVGGPSLAAFMAGTVDLWLQQRAQARFTAEGDDVVGAWKPLKPATVNIRESEGYPGPHPINVRTGELEDYITRQSGSLAVTPAGAVLTRPGGKPTPELQAKVSTAQIGSNDPRTPPRPVMGLGVSDLEYTMAALHSHLTMFITGGVGAGGGAA